MGNALDWLARPRGAAHARARPGVVRRASTDRLVGPDGAPVPLLARARHARSACCTRPGSTRSKGGGAREHVRRERRRSAGLESRADEPPAGPAAIGRGLGRRRPAVVAVLRRAGVRVGARRVVDVAAADHGLMGASPGPCPPRSGCCSRFRWSGSRTAFGRTNFNRRQRLAAGGRPLAAAGGAGRSRWRGRSSRPGRRASRSSTRSTCRTASARGDRGRGPRIDEINAALAAGALPDRRVRRRRRAVDAPRRCAQLAQVDPAQPGAPALDRRGTDLDAALDAARGELAPGHVPRIVLFSDGQPTAGDCARRSTRLAAEHVPVSVEPLAARSSATPGSTRSTCRDRSAPAPRSARRSPSAASATARRRSSCASNGEGRWRSESVTLAEGRHAA